MRLRRCGLGFFGRLAIITRAPLALIIAAVIASLGCASSASAVQTLKVSNNGRHLVKADGSPFFWTGDTAWRLYKLSRDDVDQYLNHRAAKGFNVIQGPVLLHADASNETRTWYGDSNTNPNNPDSGYFNHIDYIVDAAEQRGLYVALVATWGDTMDALGSTQSERIQSASNFGEWLGNRYRNNNNVIWIVAGEYNINGTGTDIRQVWNALGNGLKQGSGGRNLITIHASYQDGRQSSSSMFHSSPWLSFNMIQSSQSGDWGSGADNFNLVENDYDLAPTKPVIDGEAHYEGIGGWDAFGVRRRAYWSVFAGAFGHTYGANGVWQSYRGGNDDIYYGSDTHWSDAIKFPGAGDMKWLRRLMESRPMLKRVPDQTMLVTFAGNVPDRMIATRDSQGRYAMVYVPKKNKTFTVNTTPLNGSNIKAWWFDPRTGKATNAGSFNLGNTRTFTTPNKGQDWVLVMDDASRGYSKPGVGGPMQ